jgi:glycosyltransferase involved in cell wall biosynthesis
VSITKKKIAILGIKTYPAFLGADRVFENIINNTDDEFDYFIYLINTREKLTNQHNKHFIYLPALNGKHLRAFSFYVLCTLHMLFKSTYDLIHAHNSDVGLFTMILNIRYRGRILGTFHGEPYKSTKWGKLAKMYLRISEWFFIRSCDKLTSVSATKKVTGKNVLFIPNGIEKINTLKFYNYKNTSIDYERMNILKGNYILFASGRLDKIKGLHHLLEAYHKGNLHDQLLVISDFTHNKSYSHEIDEKISSLSDKNIVVWKKLLPKNDLFDVIINSKLVVFPSQIEAMSMFLLEVLACNKIVVCSDIDANIHIVGKNYRYLFKSEDAESLSAAIHRALNDIELNRMCKQTNSHTKHIMIEKYNWQDIVKNYCIIYKSYLTILMFYISGGLLL